MANEDRAAGLLERLYEQGEISEDTTTALLATGVAAAQIGSGLGEQAGGRETLLASLLIDDSTSIGTYVSTIREGHSNMLEALASEASSADVYVLTRALNRGVIAPYRPLSQALRLNESNFNTAHQVSRTPLYRESLLTLGTVLAKSREQTERGGSARTFTLIITDGGDNASGAIGSAQVRAVVTDMLEFSTDHIIAAMGIGENRDAFRATFRAMGIPDKWIFTPGSSVEALREVFRRRILPALRLAAASEAQFLQLAAGPPSA